jgi:hypothetical protein
MEALIIHLHLSSSSSDRSPQAQHHRNGGTPAIKVSLPPPHHSQAVVHKLDKRITTVAGGHALAAQDPQVDDSRRAVGSNLGPLGNIGRQSGNGRGCGSAAFGTARPLWAVGCPRMLLGGFWRCPAFLLVSIDQNTEGAVEPTTADTHHICPLLSTCSTSQCHAGDISTHAYFA